MTGDRDDIQIVHDALDRLNPEHTVKAKEALVRIEADLASLNRLADAFEQEVSGWKTRASADVRLQTPRTWRVG